MSARTKRIQGLSQTPQMTQAQLAELLNVDQSHISRIEKGPAEGSSIDFLWPIVKRLGVDPRRLGISPELIEVIEADEHEEAYQTVVSASQQQWLGVRPPVRAGSSGPRL